MSDLMIKGPLQVDISTGEAVRASIGGVPVHGPVEMVTHDGPVRDWLEELGLPKDWDQLDQLAKPVGLSTRMFKSILVDESATNFPGAWRFNPQEIRFRSGGYPLTLSHLGLVIGRCDVLCLWAPGVIPEAVGACITALATLYDSPLATAAWNGIEQKIFTHVSVVIGRTVAEPRERGTLIEVGLTDYPGCPGARILRVWEA